MVLRNDQVEGVQRLLSESTLSQRAIARATGVSRSSVGAIASGRRVPWGPDPPTAPSDELTGVRPWKCPECGSRITLPVCVACRARSQPRRRPRNEPRPVPQLTLDLSEEQLAILHGFRAEKIAAKRHSPAPDEPTPREPATFGRID